MNIYIALVSLSILILLVIIQLKVWRIRVLLSPGFYFAIMWILGITGVLLFKSLGVLIESYPEYIDELNILVGYTGFCFLLITKNKSRKIDKKNIVYLDFIDSFLLFKIMSVLILCVSFFVFFKEGSGLNFGIARENMHETISDRSVFVSYLRLISTPLSIYAGAQFILSLTSNRKNLLLKYLILLMPFGANMLFSMTEGGRVSMVYSMLEYAIGAGLSLPITFSVRKYKKVFLVGIAVFLFINGMITWIGNERDKYYGGKSTNYELAQDRLGIFSFLYGASNYMVASYVGYQYRRVDAVTAELGYGRYTFNGFINWQFPFLSQFGIKDASIAKVLGIYYHNQETYDYTREYYYATNSAYIPIIKDFGFWGVFIPIFILVYVSHNLFVKIQSYRSIGRVVTFFFYYVFFIYWAKSNFYGTLSDSILIPLYGFLIIDILDYIFRNKKKTNI